MPTSYQTKSKMPARSNKYDQKLKINATFDEAMGVLMGKPINQNKMQVILRSQLPTVTEKMPPGNFIIIENCSFPNDYIGKIEVRLMISSDPMGKSQSMTFNKQDYENAIAGKKRIFFEKSIPNVDLIGFVATDIQPYGEIQISFVVKWVC